MSGVDGEWETVTKTPMGDQSAVFTVKSDGDTFTGSQAGAMGTLQVEDGKVDGNTLTWVMNMTVPMPLKLDCKATVEGDTITGEINLGAFGVAPMSGTRKS